MQIFPYSSKEIPSQLLTRGGKVVNNGQILVNVVKERPQKVGRYLGTYIVACMETGKKFRMARSKMRNHITVED